MQECPECYSSYLSDPEIRTVNDGNQGYWQKEERDYTCNECGCEFTVVEETQRRIEISKKGDGLANVYL